jgi:hypothetical protein
MKRIAEAVSGFISGCAICIIAAVVYVALTLFPPKNRF